MRGILKLKLRGKGWEDVDWMDVAQVAQPRIDAEITGSHPDKKTVRTLAIYFKFAADTSTTSYMS
jgi:hypothetical protein